VITLATSSIDLPNGSSARVDLVLPGSELPRGAVILLHERFGLDGELRARARLLAEAGFASLAIDLYDGAVPAGEDEADELATTIDRARTLELVGAAIGWLRARLRASMKVGVMGFGVGAAHALSAASRVEGLTAAVVFYGTPRDEMMKYDDMKCPVLGHFGLDDERVSVDRADAVFDRIRAGGGDCELHHYEAAHGFLRAGDTEQQDAAAASEAWTRTMEFLQVMLLGNGKATSHVRHAA